MAEPLVCLWMRRPAAESSLARALRKEKGFRVALAGSEAEALRRAREADVLIVEADGSRRPLEFLRIVDGAQGDIDVLLLAPEGGVEPLALLEAGALAVLDVDAPTGDVLKATRALLRGESLLEPRLARDVLRRMQDLSRLCEDQGVDFARCESLSPREREVIAFMARGASNEEIATDLGVSTGTVKTHVHKILRKLGVENRRLASAYWRLFRQVGG